MSENIVFSNEEYVELCEIVGSLVISQFGDDQDAYREVITEIFSNYGWVMSMTLNPEGKTNDD